MAVVDTHKPLGWAGLWTPPARLACLLGGSDIGAHPWTVIESLLAIVGALSVRGCHIQVRVGSVPDPDPDPDPDREHGHRSDQRSR